MTKTVGNSGLIDTWAATGTQTEPNEAKKNLGWTEGERPAFDFMNFIQAQFGEKINHILANGVPLWNATDTYAANVFVSRAGVIYRSLTANTNSQPPSVNWAPIVTEATLSAAGIVRLASNAETQTGTATDRAVTPASLTSRTATESRTGIVAEATQAEVNAGTGASKFVTPAKLRLGFSVSLNQRGFIAFPTWLSGLIIQWGLDADDGATKNFPTPFPNQVYVLVGSAQSDVFDAGTSINAFIVSNSQFRIKNGGNASQNVPNYWIAIGR